jgi:hypothetical protein
VQFPNRGELLVFTRDTERPSPVHCGTRTRSEHLQIDTFPVIDKCWTCRRRDCGTRRALWVEILTGWIPERSVSITSYSSWITSPVNTLICVIIWRQCSE